METKATLFTELLTKVNHGNVEGIVLLGTGGDLNEWIEGVQKMWKQLGIQKGDEPAFSEAMVLTTTGGRHDLALPFNPNADLNVGQMAMWRLTFGDCSWISDYVVNYAGQHGYQA